MCYILVCVCCMLFFLKMGYERQCNKFTGTCLLRMAFWCLVSYLWLAEMHAMRCQAAECVVSVWVPIFIFVLCDAKVCGQLLDHFSSGIPVFVARFCFICSLKVKMSTSRQENCGKTTRNFLGALFSYVARFQFVQILLYLFQYSSLHL
jgi:hypothetical protein